MKKKKTSALLSFVTNLLQVYLKRAIDITCLASLEAKLASKTLVTIVVFLFILAFLAISTWFSLLVLLFTYLVSLHYSYLFSSFVIVIINLVCLCGVYLYIRKIKKNLFFPATRRQLANMYMIRRD